MRKMIALLCSFLSIVAFAQQQTEKQKILYGACTRDSLTAEPFGKWFNPAYENYLPSSETVNTLKKHGYSTISIKVFFGTWCGDSKREVPHFLKLLSAISFPDKQVQLVALGGSDSLLKQSPGHEEKGLGIFRVPTFIIYKNGIEINRINEYPVNSLEKDLLAILTNQPYSPNYRSFSQVFRWLKDGSLQDDNISTRGMAEQLRSLLSNEYELNNLGYLLLKQGKKKEALKVFRINYSLYPQSSHIVSSLGEGYYENGDYKNAISFLEYALELNKDPKTIKEILSILYKAKEKERS